GPLNSYVSFYKPVKEEESERVLLDIIEDTENIAPLDLIEKKEQNNLIQAQLMRTLTKLEWDVLYYYIQGLMYDEIAERIGRHEKAIDNALQRIKRKVANLLPEREMQMVE